MPASKQAWRSSSKAWAVSATMRVGAAPAPPRRAAAPRHLLAVEPRHGDVDQDGVEGAASRPAWRQAPRQGHRAVGRMGDLGADAVEHLHADQRVDLVVLGQQDPQARAGGERRGAAAHGRLRHGPAASAPSRAASERARTGLTSQPSNTAASFCPNARRSKGENSRQRVAPRRPRRAASASRLGGALRRARNRRAADRRARRAEQRQGLRDRGHDGHLGARGAEPLRPGTAAWKGEFGDDQRPAARQVGPAAPGCRAHLGGREQRTVEAEDRAAARADRRASARRPSARRCAREMARPSPVPPWRRVRAAVALLEFLEDRRRAGRRGTPGPVSATAERTWRRPAPRRRATPTPPALGELDRVAGEIDQHLPQPRRRRRSAAPRHVGRDEARRSRGPCPGRAAPAVRRRPRRAPSTSNGFGRELELARLDAGEVEDLVDQRGQRPAGGLDRRRHRPAARGSSGVSRQAGRPCPGCRSAACGSRG